MPHSQPVSEDLQVIDRMVDYIGRLGARWGLSEQGCRAHTYLYLSGQAATPAQIASALSIERDDAVEAMAFLQDYGMATEGADGRWSTGDDPWQMLVAGLGRRRQREVGPALATLRECSRDAAAQDRALAARIGKLLSLAEDLAAIDAQASRVSPRVIRSVLGLSGRAARLLDRASRP
jgi:DNA-binding transcriptional regulator GbsR (MarR family)